MASFVLLLACAEETDTSLPRDASSNSDASSDADERDVGTDALDASSDADERDVGTDALDASSERTCAPERVEFPMGGELEPGTLCDDLFVCVMDREAADRVEAASDRFRCDGDGPQVCADGIQCAYDHTGGPHVMDEETVAHICAITVLDPPPTRMMCRVYLL